MATTEQHLFTMGNKISTTQEPVIMTKDLLEEKVIQNIVHLQDLNVSELKKLVKIDGLEYDIIGSFYLEHQNLVNIDDLWRFKLLTKLEMANNLLEKIEGLDCLVNLQFLDLSFNFIKCINNLENLTNLIHLNLTSNEIVMLENMDSLLKLETFLVRHNKIKSSENINYLAQFKNLSCLAIDKNPLMHEDDSKLHLIAALPQLKYLDFEVVTSELLKEALRKFSKSTKNHVFAEENGETKFKCPLLHSDKEAYVDGLANGQGIQFLILSDRNYQLLHSFPLASKISKDHHSKANQIFDCWHEIGHKYYQQMQEEKLQFLLMISKAKEFSLKVSQKEELKFVALKEKIPKELCFIYQSSDSDDEKDKHLLELKNTSETLLQSTFRNLTNSSCLSVDLLSNMCKIYKKEISSLNEEYVKKVEECIGNLMNISRTFSEKFKEFYFNICDTGLDVFKELDCEEGELFSNNVSFLQLIQKKELINLTLDLSVRIHSTILKEKNVNLKRALHKDLVATLDKVSEEAFIRQSEQSRNTVIFFNKQKHFLDNLFSKNNIFKHYLGY